MGKKSKVPELHTDESYESLSNFMTDQINECDLSHTDLFPKDSMEIENIETEEIQDDDFKISDEVIFSK